MIIIIIIIIIGSLIVVTTQSLHASSCGDVLDKAEGPVSREDLVTVNGL